MNFATRFEATDRTTLDQALITGRVTRGRGLASGKLAHEAQASALLGRKLCPGSLNLILDAPIRLRESAAVRSADGRFLLWPASIEGVDVWVYRWPEAPLHIAELVSEQNLRSYFSFDDGDCVSVSIENDYLSPISTLEKLVWSYYWRGKQRDWFYTHDYYANWVMNRTERLGGAQTQARKRSVFYGLAELVKVAINSETPVIGRFVKVLKARFSQSKKTPYVFDRVSTADGRPFEQVINLLNYTKSSNSSYSAQEFPAAYHTIRIGDAEVRGQRDPELRFEKIPIDLKGKTVLDIGCNQGGMLFAKRDALKWGVGIDFDPRMINAANRIRVATGVSSLSFYVFDLEKEPIDLIKDFLPDRCVDVCFLLSVCMWIKNWREVIDFAQSISLEMIFETNGSEQQQADQVTYLRTRYRMINILSETSEDDPRQKNRTLIHLLNPIPRNLI